jgi:SSS family solute:Na+ symporter
VALPQSYAIQLQLLGGIWIIQTLPAVLIGLYTRWLNPWALLIGWGVGIASGTAMAASLNFAKSIYAVTIFGVTIPCYAALSSLILNLIVGVTLSAIFNALSQTREDATLAEDYL